jgi:hypothetical protein
VRRLVLPAAAVVTAVTAVRGVGWERVPDRRMRVRCIRCMRRVGRRVDGSGSRSRLGFRRSASSNVLGKRCPARGAYCHPGALTPLSGHPEGLVTVWAVEFHASSARAADRAVRGPSESGASYQTACLPGPIRAKLDDPDVTRCPGLRCIWIVRAGQADRAASDLQAMGPAPANSCSIEPDGRPRGSNSSPPV